MINKKGLFLFISLIFCNANAMEKKENTEVTETQVTNPNETQSTKVKTPSENEVAILTQDNVILTMPQNLLNMSTTLTSFLEDNSDAIKKGVPIPLSAVSSVHLKPIIEILELVQTAEDLQAIGNLDKEKLIKREDGLYILQTIYKLITPKIQYYKCKTLIEILNAVHFLDIIGSTKNQQFFTEAILKQLVNRYVLEKKINLSDIKFPIDFSSDKAIETFGPLFDQLIADLHLLAKEYITLKKIGADGKFDIADYATLFKQGIQAKSHFYFIDLSIDLSYANITSLAGIEFLNLQAEALDLEGNFLTCIKENSFKSFAKLKEINLNGNSIYTIDSQSFTHLLVLKSLTLCSNQLYFIKDLLLTNLPLTTLSLANNNIQEIHINNIPKTIEIIELNFQQIKNNIALLNEICPNAAILLCRHNGDPKEQIFIDALKKFTYKNKTIFTVNDWYGILLATILLETAKKKITSFKNNYCSIL